MSDHETAASTSGDAVASKVSACRAGYFSDPLLMSRLASPVHRRKDPMINRGTWLRVRLTEEFVRAFIKRYDGKCAVVVPGAGLDTLFWRLQERPTAWVEADLHEVCEQKARKLGMKRVESIGVDITRYVLSPEEPEDVEAHISPAERKVYTLIGCDVEQVDTFLDVVCKVVSGLPPASSGSNTISSSPSSPENGARVAPDGDSTPSPISLPTLFVSEVFASYMEADSTIRLIQSITDRFATCAFFGFEMVSPHDDFGQMMVYNMSLREVFMPTFAEIGFVSQYRQNFLLHGWDQARCITALDAYRSVLPEERARIEKLEWLDEFEQFNLIMSHYAFLMAGKNVSVDEMYDTLCEGGEGVQKAEGTDVDLEAMRARLPDAS